RRTVPVLVRTCCDPVADGRQLTTDRAFVSQPAGDLRPHLTRFGPHHVLAAMLRRDASWNQIVFEFLERGRPRVVPAEVLQGFIEQRESPLGMCTNASRTDARAQPARPPCGIASDAAGRDFARLELT